MDTGQLLAKRSGQLSVGGQTERRMLDWLRGLPLLPAGRRLGG